MKTYGLHVFFAFFLIVISFNVKSQSVHDSLRWITPDGIFDNVSDRFGNSYDLIDLMTISSKPIGGGNTVQSVPTQSCNAGYFTLFFAPGSLFSQSVQAQNVACEVFLNLSSLINSPIPNNIRVNLILGNLLGTGLGEASQFNLYPYFPTNPNQGFIMGQIEKALIFGIDPYANIPVSVFPGSNNFYYGFLNINPNQNWNYNMSTLSIGSNEYDLYTLILHEALHLLGFMSSINHDGYSNLFSFGGNNAYTKFDAFLTDNAGTPLLTSTTSTSCPNSNIIFNSGLSTTVIATTSISCSSSITPCSTAVKYSSPSQTISVFTPTCYRLGSSLSHFEDICSYSGFTSACTPTPNTGGYNDLYFVMSEAMNTGSCYVKRFPTEPEYKVLCDIGYSLTGTLTSNAILQGTSTAYTYTSGSCSPTMNIIGANDGYSGGVYTFTTTTGSAVINYTTLLNNDLPANSLTVSCIELIYNNATFTTSATDMTVSASVGAGLVLLKYLPKNSANQFGNITYIFVYFIPNGCNPSNACNMVQNGGFENLAAANPPCGGIGGAIPTVTVSCWKSYLQLPVLFASGCNSGNGYFNLGNSTLYTDVPVSNYNGSPTNTNAVGIGYFVNSTNTNVEAMLNQLSSPLVPGQSYSVSFWIINHSANPPPTTITVLNSNNSPVVISLASAPAFPLTPTLNFPSGLNSLMDFTINASNTWALVSGTFAFSSTLTNHPAFFIGLNASKTASIATTGTTSVLYCFLDDVNLVPIGSPTFALPNQTICSGQSYTNLAQYASAVTGSFTGTGVTSAFNGTTTEYHFNATGTLSPGNYPIAFNYTSGCYGTVWQNIVIQNTIGLTTSGSVSFCANAPNSLTISASVSPTVAGLTYTWLPGNLTGSAQVVNPTINTIYTVSANSPGFCSGTGTVSVDVYTACCSPTETAVSFTNPSSILPTSLSGSNMFLYNITVPTGSTTTLNGEIMFGPDVKLQVNSAGHLIIDGAHLYACGVNMWDGIEVLPGGKVTFTNTGYDNLIEDAKTAIDITGHSTSTVSPILAATRTTFNHNFIDINISSFQSTVSAYPFTINNCVFTSKNFTFNSTTWPQASTSDLRSASNPTTGLANPYTLQSLSTSNLKLPFSSQPSHIAIQLNNVGVTTGTVFSSIEIGSSSNASDFNLFDSHGKFISASTSNIVLKNNVYQNTQRYYTVLSNTPFITGNFGGQAVHLSNGNTQMNMKLDLTASNTSLGNRFWNCHFGVAAQNLYRFNIENGLFRSTQSTTLTSGIQQGYSAIQLNTNRMQYYIKENEFTNINTCINIPVAANSYTSIGTGTALQYGIYGANIAVLNNTFSPGTGSNNYLNKAVNINFVNNYTVAVAPSSATPYPVGINIERNKIVDAFRGIYIWGVTGFYATANQNEITLKPDNVFNIDQHGVDMSANLSSLNVAGRYSIFSNTLSSTNATHTPVSLVFCDNNMGLHSPSVTCNNQSNAYCGFVFSGPNNSAVWAGNAMQPLGRGLTLENSAVIGTQGSNGTASNNQWISTWTGTANVCTHVSNASAAGSVLYVKNSSSTLPANNSPTTSPTDFYSLANGYIQISPGGDYGCSGDPNSFVLNVPLETDYDDYRHCYIALTSLYRFLHFNDSIKESDGELVTFYTGLDDSNIDKYLQLESAIYEGDLSVATSIYSGITADGDNDVDLNYKTFYGLYINYLNALQEEEEISTTDSTSLFELASQCPALYGPCIYQARSLYNTIYNVSLDFNDCSENLGSRMFNNNFAEGKNNPNEWILIYPNPTTNNLSLINARESEKLSISISDISGRIVNSREVTISNHKGSFEFELINGLYVLSIQNQNNETAVYKLIISE